MSSTLDKIDPRTYIKNEKEAAFFPRYEDIIEKVKTYNPSTNETLLKRAYLISGMAHDNVSRRDGTPYLSHPLSVVYILAELRMDDTGLVAGFLHDAVEDNQVVKIEKIRELFGEEVAHIVSSVTKIESDINFHRDHSKDEAQIENIRRLILGMARDIRVIFVKLADRLHNLRTMDSMPEEKAKIKAEECLKIFAPIANRLGLGKIKNELEDLSFKYAYPEEYKKLTEALKEKRNYSDDFINETKEQIITLLKKDNIEAEVTGRVKHLYSIYRKLIKQNIDISQVYDYMAFRILVNEVYECYATLGNLHSKWTHIPYRLKDFISNPKENGYRSLHTSLLSKSGEPFEVQIRTFEMHEEAEQGIAAHWMYKEGKVINEDDKILEKFRKDIQELMTDPSQNFVSELPNDLQENKIYVFSPKGDLYHLPVGATALDFAYLIHSNLGDHCAGAKVDGKMVPLKTPLKNGQKVEILKSPDVHPTYEWLDIAVSSRAKTKIRNYLTKNEKIFAIERGKDVFERELRRFKKSLKSLESDPNIVEEMKKNGFQDINTLYAEIGYGKVDARSFLKRVLGEEEVKPLEVLPSKKKVSLPLSLNGKSDYLFNIARCCNPVMGEQIVGYVTVGKGLVIHRRECPNIKRLSNIFPERVEEVNWKSGEEKNENEFEIPLSVVVTNRTGVLADVTVSISQEKADITACDAKSLRKKGKGKNAIIKLKLLVKNKDHLNKILKNLSEIDGVISINRS